jgi:hypothetical protein
MMMPVFLNSIQVFGMYGVNFEQTFIINNKVQTTNHIRIKNEDEADMWSAIIELFTSIGESVIYPTDWKEDWVVILTYSIWDEPLDYYDRPFKIIQVKIECTNGEIIEEAHEIQDGIYIEIPNDTHSKEGASKLEPQVIENISQLHFYRWNPRLSNLDCINDYSYYFLNFHKHWYVEDPINYREEMESVVSFMRDKFESLIIKYEPPRTIFEVLIVESDMQIEIPLERMDDDFQNMYLAYGEFKKYKDNIAGVMGFYMTDCKASMYISLFTSMLAGALERSKSQFFFMYWDDEKLEKLTKTYISQMDY